MKTLAVALILAAAQPLPVPKPPIAESCPAGWGSSGSYCTPHARRTTMKTSLADQGPRALLSAFWVASDQYRRGVIGAQTYRDNLIALLNECSAEQLDKLAEVHAPGRSPPFPIVRDNEEKK